MDCVVRKNTERNILFERWMGEYGTAMLRICIIYLFDVKLAERAMQNTFLKAYHYMDQLVGKGTMSEKALLMRIAIHTLRKYRRISRLRTIGRHKAVEQPDFSLVELAEQKKVMFQAIMELPAKQKEVLLLSHYQDMAIEYVDAILHLSKSIVQYRLKTAIEKIRSKLAFICFYEKYWQEITSISRLYIVRMLAVYQDDKSMAF